MENITNIEMLDIAAIEFSEIAQSVLKGNSDIESIRSKVWEFNQGTGKIYINQRQADGNFIEGTFCRGAVTTGIGSTNEVGALLISADDLDGAPLWLEISKVQCDFFVKSIEL